MIACRLKELREQAGMKKSETARRFGMPYTTYSNYEAGTREPGAEELIKFADSYGVTIDYLMGRSAAEGGVDNLLPIETQKIPLLGTIAAGQPIIAREEFDSYIAVGTEVRADFALKVKGDSMINARICDGDIVFIRSQPIVENGEIAAVLLGEEATLKRFYRNGDLVTLLAENPNYAPITILLDESAQIRVLGKAVAFQSNVK